MTAVLCAVGGFWIGSASAAHLSRNYGPAPDGFVPFFAWLGVAALATGVVLR